MTSLCEIELRLGEEAAEGARQKEEWSEWDQRHRTRRDLGNGAFGGSDIEGKVAMGSGE